METITKAKIPMQIEKICKIQEMIDSCIRRININRQMSESTFGRNKKGNINCGEMELRYENKYQSILVRLKKAYNNQLSVMSKYKL